MTPTQSGFIGIKGTGMSLQNRYLDEYVVIMLFCRHKSSDDILDQVSATFRHRVEECWGGDWRSDKTASEFLQSVRLQLNSRHLERDAPLLWSPNLKGPFGSVQSILYSRRGLFHAATLWPIFLQICVVAILWTGLAWEILKSKYKTTFSVQTLLPRRSTSC